MVFHHHVLVVTSVFKAVSIVSLLFLLYQYMYFFVESVVLHLSWSAVEYLLPFIVSV